MRTESRKLLFDVAEACRAIQEFNPRGTLAEYSGDKMRRAATERMFEIIGEALTRLRNTDLVTLGRLSEAHRIIGFRNRLIHGYDRVDDEVVWRVVWDDSPILLKEVESLLNELDARALPNDPT